MCNPLPKSVIKKAGTGDIQFKGSIDAVLEAKRLNEEMQTIASMINMRFPKAADQKSTWQEIIDHHNQALREQKEARQKAALEALRKQHEIEETIKAILLIAVVGVIGLGLFVFLFLILAKA
jgi:predicted nucleotidyltransferase